MDERTRRKLWDRRQRKAASEAQDVLQAKLSKAVAAVLDLGESPAALAEELRVDVAVLNRLVREDQKNRANARIPDDVMSLLSNDSERRALFAELEQESGSFLPLHWRFDEAVRGCRLTTREIHQVFAACEPAEDLRLEGLVFRQEFPRELLLELIESERLITAIAHRSGPQEVLEAVLEKYPWDEPIKTLIVRYYADESYPIAEFLRFVWENREHLSPRFFEGVDALSPERQKKALMLLS